MKQMIERLPPGTEALLRRAWRFGCVGLCVTALHVVVAMGFLSLVAPRPVPANGAAFIVATIVSYWVNTHWSFSGAVNGRTLRRFVLVAGLGLLMTMGIARVAELAGLPHWQGIVAVICIMPAFTFLLHNFWTYR